MDLMDLTKSEGWDSTLVVVDRLSKYVHFIGLKDPFFAMIVVEAFMEVVMLHDIPRTIGSNHDKVLLSLFWTVISLTGYNSEAQHRLSSSDQQPNEGAKQMP